MRSLVMVGLLAIVLSLPAHGEPAPNPPSCAIQKARDVSFRNAKAEDVLEVSIGTGPCFHTTLTIVIRTKEAGHTLYSYVDQFGKHVGDDASSPTLVQDSVAFVEGLLARGIQSTESLPPWLPADKYEQEHQATLDVSREVYEGLRKNPRPMFSHPTYFEGWTSVVWDEKEGKAITVLSGGV